MTKLNLNFQEILDWLALNYYKGNNFALAITTLLLDKNIELEDIIDYYHTNKNPNISDLVYGVMLGDIIHSYACYCRELDESSDESDCK